MFANAVACHKPKEEVRLPPVRNSSSKLESSQPYIFDENTNEKTQSINMSTSFETSDTCFLEKSMSVFFQNVTEREEQGTM